MCLASVKTAEAEADGAVTGKYHNSTYHQGCTAADLQTAALIVPNTAPTGIHLARLTTAATHLNSGISLAQFWSMF